VNIAFGFDSLKNIYFLFFMMFRGNDEVIAN